MHAITTMALTISALGPVILFVRMFLTTAWKMADVLEIPITPPADLNRYDMDVIVAIST
jgi:hypothetical protein